MSINPELLKILVCPVCKSALKLQNNKLVCIDCGREYSIIDGVPILLSKNDVSKQTKKQIEYFSEEFCRNAEYMLYPWQRNYIENRIAPFFNTDYQNKILIDIGTGSGYCAIEFAKKGMTVIACDLTLESILRLKRERDRLGMEDKIFLVVCSAEELPFSNNICDFFICNAVLEHLENDTGCIKGEIGRICKLNSKGFVVVPLKLKCLWPIFWLPAYIHDKKIGHLRRYDYNDLKDKFSVSGFKIYRVFYTGHFLKTIGTIVSTLLKTHRWDKKFEKWDNKKINKKYGANNISICLDRIIISND